MCATNTQITNARTRNKRFRPRFVAFLAPTILCFVAAGSAFATTSTEREAVPGGHGIVSARDILMLMLDSLIAALDEEPEEPAELTGDGLDVAAQALILGYTVVGVNPDLLPAEALEAAETTDHAEWILLTEVIGLDSVLADDLLETLELMNSDLVELSP